MIQQLETLAGKSVFVTGHTGLKGSWLSLWLSKLGAQVTGYALDPPTDPNHFTVAKVEDVLANHHIGDVRDVSLLKRTIAEAQPDIVLHLAAQSVVRTSFEIPHETFEVNTMGTVNVLEAVRQLGHPCSIVCVTSDKCYQNVEQVWGYREMDAMGEHDPYGGSKGAAELAIRSYRCSFFPPEKYAQHGVKLASARAGNVIGGGDWTKDALIPDIVKAIINNETIELRYPNALRPWQHILQALSGYLFLATTMHNSDDVRFMDAFNFGPLPGNEIPVSEVVDEFCREWGSGKWAAESNVQHPHESQVLRLAVDKALWTLGWKPGWPVRETIRRTASWFRAWHEGEPDMQSLSLSQIEAYENFVADDTPVAV